MAKKTFLDPIMTPVERVIYTLGGIDSQSDMNGWQYAQSVLYSNLAMGILVFSC
jgi:K+-transporting ATPase ATPase A chain